MNSKIAWEAEYSREIERARLARSDGNEGMARVCARRAAGIVVGEYLHRRGITGLSNSVYHRLAVFNDLPEVDDAIKRVGNHFLMKVNQDHNLPVNTDLIQDAAWLKNVLLAPRG